MKLEGEACEDEGERQTVMVDGVQASFKANLRPLAVFRRLCAFDQPASRRQTL